MNTHTSLHRFLILLTFLPLLLLMALSLNIFYQHPAKAQFDPTGSLCSGAGGNTTVDKNTKLSNGCTGAKGSKTLFDIMLIVVNALIFIVGAASVFMLVYAGVQYVTSQGEAAAITKAKNTIIYSLIGIAIAFSAYAIVNYVIGLFK